MNARRRVVITGLGVVTPLGCRVEPMWRRLLAGESGVRPLSIIDTAGQRVTFGGDIPDWNPTEFITDKEVKRLDRFSQFALVAASEAVQDAGIDFSRENPFRCGSILGSGIGGLNEMEEQTLRLVQQGPTRVSALTIPKQILNAAGAQISIRWGLRGICATVATACASAANALHDAMHAIRNNLADVIVSGGSEAAITRLCLAGFANMRALSTRNHDPSRASRPWDRQRDGFIMSEGAGIVVLEELEHARARGARIYCELRGAGATSDGSHITQPDEHGACAAEAMSQALRDARLEPHEVDYVNAHGTSTELGDKAETRALKRVFGDHARRLSVSSIKSQLGHTLGASGGIELVAAVKSLTTGWVPPTINLDDPDPECDLDYTPHQARQRTLRNVMSNSFGFGGHNAVLVIGHLN